MGESLGRCTTFVRESAESVRRSKATLQSALCRSEPGSTRRIGKCSGQNLPTDPRPGKACSSRGRNKAPYSHNPGNAGDELRRGTGTVYMGGSKGACIEATPFRT